MGLDKLKPVIVCGDMNVAHCEIDLKNPDTNHFNPGFSDEERGKFTELLDAGFIDASARFTPISAMRIRGGATVRLRVSAALAYRLLCRIRQAA